MFKKIILGSALLVVLLIVLGFVLLRGSFNIPNQTDLVAVIKLKNSSIGLFSWYAWDGATWHVIEFESSPPKNIKYSGGKLSTKGTILHEAIESHGTWGPVTIAQQGPNTVEFCGQNNCITKRSVAPTAGKL